MIADNILVVVVTFSAVKILGTQFGNRKEKKISFFVAL